MGGRSVETRGVTASENQPAAPLTITIESISIGWAATTGQGVSGAGRREAVMADVLDEAYGIVQCKDCPWYKSCVMPMRLSAEDIRRQLESSAAGMMGIPQQGDIAGIQGLLGGMATAAQNSLLEGCPVFIQRLRSSQELAQRIKKLMQAWGQEEASETKEKPPSE